LQHSSFQVPYDAFGLLKKSRPFVSEFDMPTCSAEQPHSQAALQILNRSRQGRLGNAHRRRSLSEVQPLGDCNEMPQLAQLWSINTHDALISVQ
jgi:hypothetical protein